MSGFNLAGIGNPVSAQRARSYAVNQSGGIVGAGVLRPGSGSVSNLSSQITGALTKVSISSYGRKAADLFQEIRSMGDMQKQSQASEGFRAMMVGFASNPDSKGMSAIMSRATDLSQSDKAGMASFLGTVGQVKREGYSLTQFGNTLSEIGSAKDKNTFVEQSSSIMNGQDADKSARKETISLLNTAFSKVANSSGSAEEKSGLMDKLRSGLESAKGVNEKKSFLTDFMSKNFPTEKAAA